MKSGDKSWRGEAVDQTNMIPTPCFAAQLPSFVTFAIDLNLSELISPPSKMALKSSLQKCGNAYKI